jgi:hypothetical protein
MRYFIPEWDDRVDPNYDFLNDEHSSQHKKDPFSDYYMWEVFGLKHVPFDGILVSRVKIEENKKKLANILELGIHNFLRLPDNFTIMGDCGAFGYINERVPRYDAVEILNYYQKVGFNIGVTVDHLVVRKFKDQKDYRMRITFENGLKGFDAWNRNYRNSFQLLVSVQGWEISDYIKMFKDYYRYGIRDFAFGGLARRTTWYISLMIDKLAKVVKEEHLKPTYIHFFGLGRVTLFTKYKELEDLGIEISFDSASWLRRAWLSGVNYFDNYYMINGELRGYHAIRIPQVTKTRTGLRGKKKLGEDLDLEKLKILEHDCLDKLRLYDADKIEIDNVIKSLKEFDKILGKNRNIEQHYRKTLLDRPWKKCSCPICKSLGVETIIFRGNNRNRRRGFHNTFLIYHEIFKRPERWFLVTERERRREETIELQETDLKALSGKVLVVTQCTKRKLSYNASIKAPAKKMYRGKLFEAIREFCESKKFDYVIISAKYGLLLPEEIIEGYEKVLRTREDIEAIRPLVEQRLKPLLTNYEKIVVIAGKKYRKILSNLWDDRFFIVRSKGYGDLCTKIKEVTLRDQTLEIFI